MPDDTPAPSQSTADTAAGYDLVASEYANRIVHELDHKPFDRLFLDDFAGMIPAGKVLDLGCGPGHVGRYLSDKGMSIVGLDISEAMLKIARDLNPGIEFERGDMRKTGFADRSFAGVVAFYSIIHFAPGDLPTVFAEVRRILIPGGVLALAFHVGSHVLHVDELFGIKTSLDFSFFEPAQVQEALSAAGFVSITSAQRPPYPPPVEAQTQRCYMLADRIETGAAARCPPP